MRPERSAPSAVAARWNARTEPSANCLPRMAATRVTVSLRGSLRRARAVAGRLRASVASGRPAGWVAVAGAARPTGMVRRLGGAGRGPRAGRGWSARRRGGPWPRGVRCPLGSAVGRARAVVSTPGGRRGAGRPERRRRGGTCPGTVGRRVVVGIVVPGVATAGRVRVGRFRAGAGRGLRCRTGSGRRLLGRPGRRGVVDPRRGGRRVGTIGGAAPDHSDPSQRATGQTRAQPSGTTIRTLSITGQYLPVSR